MNFGNGGIIIQSKDVGGASVPPFPLNSAENGLSVDSVTGRIVLGNNTGGISASLLSDREIPIDTFSLSLSGNNIVQTIDDTAPGLFTIRDGLLNRVFQIDALNKDIIIGDVDNSLNGTYLFIDGFTNSFSFNTGFASLLLNLDGRTQITDSNLLLRISPFNGITQFYKPAVNTRTQFYDGGGINGIEVQSSGQVIKAIMTGGITIQNSLKITGDTTLIHTGTNLLNGAGAAAGTLNNAPAAGNPTKWIAIDDNGTTRFIPAW